MKLNQRTIALIQISLALAALLLLAAGISGVRFEAGQELNLLGLLLGGQAPTAPPSVAYTGGFHFEPWMRVAFWVVLIVTMGYALLSPEGRRRLFITLVFVALLLFIADRYLDGREQPPLEPPIMEGTEGLPDAPPVVLPEPPPFVEEPPAWLYWLVDVIVVLAFIFFVWYVWRRLRPAPDSQSLLVEEAASALAELEAGGDLRDVVLRCYMQMSEVLKQSHRVERRQTMTPREFEVQLAAAGLRDEHIHRLTRLFEGVRYGTQSGTGKAAQEASECLQAIVQSYGARA